MVQNDLLFLEVDMVALIVLHHALLRQVEIGLHRHLVQVQDTLMMDSLLFFRGARRSVTVHFLFLLRRVLFAHDECEAVFSDLD